MGDQLFKVLVMAWLMDISNTIEPSYIKDLSLAVMGFLLILLLILEIYRWILTNDKDAQ